jgi:putative hemolysin
MISVPVTRFSPRFALRLAQTGEDLAAAQALRHRVFVEELGTRGGELTAGGLEADRFDRHFEHLLLLDTLRDGAVIGTTRVATEAAAARAGGFASEQEFDISALRRTGQPLLEVGRTCLDASHRGGEAMHRLWQGLAVLVEERGAGLLFGLASFHGTDPAGVGQPLSLLHHDHLAPEGRRPRSLRPVPMDRLPREEVDRRVAVLATPALVKAYLRLGARVGEGAYLDGAFGCLDVCMVLDTASLSARARAIYGATPA